ncbi:RNA polymerase sigma factor SigZ [Aureibacter tunicatorum]|uniref:RNA polymerase sigma factor SigZ n=1 Tax=Aureibacter tunicatorum TaxID=866807 RepID=A0AAE3XIP7_9BACT|nr:RNA polymerase sigma factor SigZ [Aureibacter tunicatorum]MDR6238461.1 RNA polymerase sigma-70 factor (ECF subfamily) [Aureibacter tunicatorum]BDD05605.1 RNA polymerase sigma factor SigZ [Aureibacter tunicatorum]
MKESQIQELYNPLFLYVRKRINNQEDAEDLTQEVFLKLSKSDSDKVDSLKSWVYTIAKNTITDYYRKKKLQTEVIEDNTFVDEYNENNVVEELGGCIAAYLDKLPDDYRELMKLSEIEGVPQKEIAKQLGLNYVTVRSKIQRGRKKLKNIFSDCCTVSQGGKGSIMSYEEKSNCSSNADDGVC